MSLTGVSKRFGATAALVDVTLAVNHGEIVALLGRNGAGKTTLLRIMAASLVPDVGSVTVAGIDVLAAPDAVRRRVGLLLAEERSHYWRLGGQANLEFFAALHGLRRRAARAHARRLLEEVGLGDASSQPVGQWSTGMRMRLALARALLGAPSVLLLDEPTRSLDPLAAEELRSALRTAARDRGLTVVIATHDLHEPAALGARCGILERGKLVAQHPSGAASAELEAALRSADGYG